MPSEIPTTKWQTCPIGSCSRHQDCMYTPCRAVQAPSKTTALEWWEKHHWVSWNSVTGFARCEKCGLHAMDRSLNERCEGQAK